MAAFTASSSGLARRCGGCARPLAMRPAAHATARMPAARPVAARAAVAAVNQGTTDDAKFADYAPKLAFFFPGQGAQSVGMAKDIVAEVPAAKALFERASDVLGYDLLKLCSEGPKDKLDSTVVSQPAIYVASLAALEKLRHDEGEEAVNAADVTCGLSLGEYTALTYAGAISFEDGLKLVKLRGESMQAAADAQPSGMVSILKLDADRARPALPWPRARRESAPGAGLRLARAAKKRKKLEPVEELCRQATEQVGEEGGVRIANFLCPGNYAVSGGVAGCDAIEKLAKDAKARSVRLAVAGAFHTRFMQPAEDKLREALASTQIVSPRIPVISNVDTQPHADPAVIKDILARQLTSPVQWQRTLETLLGKGLERSYEIGPNKVIAGIMKRIDKGHSVTNVTA